MGRATLQSPMQFPTQKNFTAQMLGATLLAHGLLPGTLTFFPGHRDKQTPPGTWQKWHMAENKKARETKQAHVPTLHTAATYLYDNIMALVFGSEVQPGIHIFHQAHVFLQHLWETEESQLPFAGMSCLIPSPQSQNLSRLLVTQSWPLL